MTPHKIIKLLQMPYAEAKTKGMTDQYRKAITMVRKALKKQIPQQVIYEDVGYDTYTDQNIYACICPSCGLYILGFGGNDIVSKADFGGDVEKMFHSCLVHHNYEGLNHFCNRCGQALDWGI